jgi:hypothetical protein
VRPAAPRRVRLVRVRARIGKPVPVRRAPAQVAALLQRLRRHRGPHPDPGPGDLPLRRQPQRYHRLLVILGVPVDPLADLRHPQLDPVVLEQRGHRGVLAAVERPLVLPDHDRVPPALRISQLRHQRSRLRAPRPRRHRILPVLSRDPPVKREPQHPACASPARPERRSAHDASTSPPAPPQSSRDGHVATTEFIFRYRPTSITDHSYRTRPPVNINLSRTHSTSSTTRATEPHGATEKGKLHALSTRQMRTFNAPAVVNNYPDPWDRGWQHLDHRMRDDP